MRLLMAILALGVLGVSSDLAWASGEPVVFAHGLGISAEVYEALVPMQKLFRAAGREVLIARTPVAGTIAERAKILAQECARLVPEGRFHIIGHSMGGLDARLAIARHGLGERVISLTTLATPHRGSPVADFVVSHVAEASMIPILSSNLDSARDLTTSNMAKFNARVPDDTRVRYFSMGFMIPEPVERHSFIPWLWFAHGLVSDAGAGDSDGMVSVDSARWGEYLGTFGGDHYSETGPVPFSGGPDYREVFSMALENINTKTP